MSDVLRRICEDKREHIAARKSERSPGSLREQARAASAPRGFQASLRRAAEAGRFGLIAEIKKASPSKGLIRADFDPPALARAYRAGGATCLSVLTDERWFQGSDAYLVAAREAVDLPVLRKDFFLDTYQVWEARALGADCVLIIMAALEDAVALELEAAAMELGMDVLVEVHNREELERALRLRSGMIGINNRNLKTLDVDLATTEELARFVPHDRLLVCESGLRTTADLSRMQRCGASCFLVGEHLMSQPQVEAATRTLLGTTETTLA